MSLEMAPIRRQTRRETGALPLWSSEQILRRNFQTRGIVPASIRMEGSQLFLQGSSLRTSNNDAQIPFLHFLLLLLNCNLKLYF